VGKLKMLMYESTKRFTGYSTCFRQWRADSHCQFLHGYALEFNITFAGKLDDRNWVMDFGAFKANGLKNDFKLWFDHTTIIAEDDPHLSDFIEMDQKGLIQLRTMVNVGCESFAKFIFCKTANVVEKETGGRVRVVKVTCHETQNNSANYRLAESENCYAETTDL
tara:strand:+ start:1281 stop:1775 length:495 start_codon:yes stop_codon:yes gene_type:complete